MTPSELWLPPPSVLTLSEGEVHVWRVPLDSSTAAEHFAGTLSPDELARAARFRFQRDRDRFSACRSGLRAILARYLQCEPREVAFSYSGTGKPALAMPAADRGLEFNLSHSGGYALYAVARSQKVGVDIEQIRDDMPCEQIAGQFFSPAENRHLLALPESLRRIAFFFIWTRKEAYVKATGEGLSLPLDRFDVLTPQAYPAFTPFTIHDVTPGAPWSVQDLAAFPECAASIVVEGAFPLLRCWQHTRNIPWL